MPRLWFTKVERPIVAQIWGQKPEHYKKIAQELVEMGFDGIDINMGCPEKTVMKQGNCSALINNPTHAKEIIRATQEGAGDLPVSVKTRIGTNKIITEEWIGFLLSLDLEAITVHGRTSKEMSKVPAHWDEIAKAVRLRNEMGKETIIVGNGDVKSLAEADQKVQDTGVDGVMIGRGIFENFWVFDRNWTAPTVAERFEILLEHTRLFKETWGESKNFNILKKFYKIYMSDFEGAKEIRVKLMEAKTFEDVEALVNSFMTQKTVSHPNSQSIMEPGSIH